MYWDSPPARALRAAGIPVYRAVESAVAGLEVLAADAVGHPLPIPSLPPAAPPVEEAGYSDARAALADTGVPFGRARTVHDRDAALAAATELGYPVVLKALGALHKSDAGGVVLGLQNADELSSAVEQLAAGAYSVEVAENTAAGLELLVGARRDPRFGPVVVVGAGGTYADLFRDTAVALAPVDEPGAGVLLRSLACAPLLAGARGRPPLDLAAAASAIAALSRFAASHPEIAEVEVNPLLVRQAGAVGLDARIVLATQSA
jgi:acyl-CoA synthetase (NDP forming)